MVVALGTTYAYAYDHISFIGVNESEDIAGVCDVSVMLAKLHVAGQMFSGNAIVEPGKTSLVKPFFSDFIHRNVKVTAFPNCIGGEMEFSETEDWGGRDYVVRQDWKAAKLDQKSLMEFIASGSVDSKVYGEQTTPSLDGINLPDTFAVATTTSYRVRAGERTLVEERVEILTRFAKIDDLENAPLSIVATRKPESKTFLVHITTKNIGKTGTMTIRVSDQSLNSLIEPKTEL